ncbi:hypothetical protein VIAQ111709_04250 [Vibrio aquimaris]|uniref:Uncharacterized protein n=1 Tax=Vibrio aquimaris TaxID=2587862 RepID=A0A5P9CII0_9VIBR|nr:hypothetical protein FIV01_06795 [Vibrio aquimaris]
MTKIIRVGVGDEDTTADPNNSIFAMRHLSGQLKNWLRSKVKGTLSCGSIHPRLLLKLNRC